MSSPIRRPQFTLKTLLWLMAVVAAFCAGVAWNNQRWEGERRDLQEEMERSTISARAEGDRFRQLFERLVEQEKEKQRRYLDVDRFRKTE